ncbi:catalase HPII, partial [bacterium M00.F.Ca.ET.152.01.1.1]
DDLEPSPALSIINNGPDSFKGRKIGVLVSDGIDSGLLQAIRDAAQAEGAKVEIVARRVGGVEAGDGSWIGANHMIDGGPSVLFDAMVLLVSQEGAEMLSRDAAAKDFVSDAFAHLKFIGFVAGAGPLLASAGV